MKIAKILLCMFIIIAFAPADMRAAEPDHADIRRQAQKAYKDGNWKDAYQLFRRLCLETENDPKMVGRDLMQAWQCLRYLNRLNQLDKFREAVIKRHNNNWIKHDK